LHQGLSQQQPQQGLYGASPPTHTPTAGAVGHLDPAIPATVPASRFKRSAEVLDQEGASEPVGTVDGSGSWQHSRHAQGGVEGLLGTQPQQGSAQQHDHQGLGDASRQLFISDGHAGGPGSTQEPAAAAAREATHQQPWAGVNGSLNGHALQASGSHGTAVQGQGLPVVPGVPLDQSQQGSEGPGITLRHVVQLLHDSLPFLPPAGNLHRLEYLLQEVRGWVGTRVFCSLLLLSSRCAAKAAPGALCLVHLSAVLGVADVCCPCYLLICACVLNHATTAPPCSCVAANCMHTCCGVFPFQWRTLGFRLHSGLHFEIATPLSVLHYSRCPNLHVQDYTKVIHEEDVAFDWHEVNARLDQALDHCE
jgi:hypothetical protein